jgi:hypothetical protein
MDLKTRLENPRQIDDIHREYEQNPMFKTLVDMLFRALIEGEIDVQHARAAGLMAVNLYAVRIGWGPMAVVQIEGDRDGAGRTVTVDGVRYVPVPRAGR